MATDKDRQAAELPSNDIFPVVREGYEVEYTGDWERINGSPFRRGVLQDGRPVLVYESGAIKSAEGRGAFITAGPEHMLTSETAPILREKFQEQAQQAFIDGLIEADGGDLSRGWLSAGLRAWSSIGKAQHIIASDPERGRSSTEAAKFIGRAAGFLVDDKGSAGDGSITIKMTMAAGDVADLVAALRGRSLGSGE